MELKIKELNKTVDELIGPDTVAKVCPNNHPLIYNLVSKTLLGYSWCDKCKVRCDKISSVRWTCKKCNYDQCLKCGIKKTFAHICIDWSNNLYLKIKKLRSPALFVFK